MYGKPGRDIRWLRERLVEARVRRSRVILEEVEAGLRRLAEARYRCCLLDFERCEPVYYVRLMGYEKGRVRAELEYPVKPGLRALQWLPLSHLADYGEVQSREHILRIYAGLAPFIRRAATPLEKRRPRLLPVPRPGGTALSPDSVRLGRGRRPRARVWWYVGGVILLMSLGVLLAMQLGNHYLL
jgi:hypothetical protein